MIGAIVWSYTLQEDTIREVLVRSMGRKSMLQRVWQQERIWQWEIES